MDIHEAVSRYEEVPAAGRGDLEPGRTPFSHLHIDGLAIIPSEFLAFVLVCLSLPLL